MSSLRSWVSHARPSLRGGVVKYHGLSNGSMNGHTNRHVRSASGSANLNGNHGYFRNWLSLRKARIGLLVGFISAFLLLFAGANIRPTHSHHLYPLRPPRPHTLDDQPSDDLKPQHLRLIISASKSDENLCKALVSAAVAGYPPPLLVNWNQTFDDPSLIYNGEGIAKIDGVLNQLNALGPRYDDDLVLLVDSHDTWFQLRPNVLLERYFDIISRENERIWKQMGHAMDIEHVSSKVVFAAQKKCWPKDGTNPACYAVPESPLPQDVYGIDTDKTLEDDPSPYRKLRPRYLNIGSLIGPVRALRKIFQRAHEKTVRYKNIGLDQGIFSEMFGYQEAQRRVMMMRNRSLFVRLVDWLNKRLGREYSYRLIDRDRAEGRYMMQYQAGNFFEMGISLDYGMQISQATVFSEYDTEWISYEDRMGIYNTTKQLGISLPPRVGYLPMDVAASLPPFYDRRHGKYPGGSLPMETTWNQVPLLTNMYTGVSPAMVHHDAHHNKLDKRIETHWNKTWFHPYARAMFDAHALMPQHQIAITYGSGREQSWWGPTYFQHENEWGGAASDTEEWLNYEQLCKGTWDEVFRDGKGDWNDPRYREAPPQKENVAPVPQVGDASAKEDEVEKDTDNRLLDAMFNAVAKASTSLQPLATNLFDTDVRS